MYSSIFLNHMPYLEREFFLNMKPIQWFQHRGYMLKFWCIRYGSSQLIMNTLQLLQILLHKANKKQITVNLHDWRTNAFARDILANIGTWCLIIWKSRICIYDGLQTPLTELVRCTVQLKKTSVLSRISQLKRKARSVKDSSHLNVFSCCRVSSSNGLRRRAINHHQRMHPLKGWGQRGCTADWHIYAQKEQLQSKIQGYY